LGCARLQTRLDRVERVCDGGGEEAAGAGGDLGAVFLCPALGLLAAQKGAVDVCHVARMGRVVVRGGHTGSR
jgi:hypothetical protein